MARLQLETLSMLPPLPDLPSYLSRTKWRMSRIHLEGALIDRTEESHIPPLELADKRKQFVAFSHLQLKAPDQPRGSRMRKLCTEQPYERVERLVEFVDGSENNFRAAKSEAFSKRLIRKGNELQAASRDKLHRHRISMPPSQSFAKLVQHFLSAISVSDKNSKLNV